VGKGADSKGTAINSAKSENGGKGSRAGKSIIGGKGRYKKEGGGCI
jgi:hypothetical protein